MLANRGQIPARHYTIDRGRAMIKARRVQSAHQRLKVGQQTSPFVSGEVCSQMTLSTLMFTCWETSQTAEMRMQILQGWSIFHKTKNEFAIVISNFLKGTIDSIAWSFPYSRTTLHALIGGSSWSMTSSKLEDTFGKSSLQVSTSGSCRAVLTKSLYVTWQNGYVGQPNKVATSKMGTCSGMWKNSLCSSSSLTSSAPEKSILTCWWKSRSLKNSPWFFRKLINCCLQIVRTLGQVKETLSIHLGHMLMCSMSTCWSWAPQLGLPLGPFQSPVNISSEEEDLADKEEWIWKS